MGRNSLYGMGRWRPRVALVLAGCAVEPDYERPEVALPEAWPGAVGEQMDKDSAAAEFWWERFEDPRLDRLVRDALENDLDAGIAAARVVPARAEWLPSLNLAALFGQEASGVSQLASGDSAIWELLVGSTVPLLDFGRRQATIDGVEAEYTIAELEYRLAIQEALVEVGNAWSVLNAAHERVEARQREMRARIEVLDLAERRYLGGFVGYLEVLDARRALLDASLTLTEASRDRLAATATLFRALGGGWDSAAIPSDVLEDGDPDDAKEEAVTPADPDD
ncbi:MULTISPECIES: TolC family protein [unclassified Thioalkalivibrio]|uniref:TolC family protein n=1 Tax=unclassified Thioalkalivibrio TaxID=2621013 RepID=UPI0003706129|nr:MULTISPECIES: TolC family protein [unclassified Thioalkalivibrio]